MGLGCVCGGGGVGTGAVSTIYQATASILWDLQMQLLGGLCPCDLGCGLS